MLRILIAAYIVLVLVISAKAGSSATQDSGLLDSVLKYSSEAP
jgi:hypothetical protein